MVGSGPAGFYAADLLLRAGAKVDVFERLPAPFGLVRYGVAPDHQNIKRAVLAFERTAEHPNFRYFGNVTVGQVLSVEELLLDYDQVLLAVGSAGDRKLGIPGEELAGSVAATAFVGWYNGHPDFIEERFPLDVERAVIVGMGNVALDVARVLVRRPAELATTDITASALEALAQSRVREVVLLGRRGPAQAAFDQGELADIAGLEGVEVILEGDVPAVGSDLTAAARRKVEYLATLPRAPSGRAERLVRLRFFAVPRRILGEEGRVSGVEIERTALAARPDGALEARPTGETETLSCGLLVRSIGYRGTPISGLPFDAVRGVVPNSGGRVGAPGERVARCYVAGWIKRGPVGLLGSNKQDARETVEAMLADRDEALAGRSARHPGRALDLLAERGIRWVSYRDWVCIDAKERAAGEKLGKVREKFCSVQSMLLAIDERASGSK